MSGSSPIIAGAAAATGAISPERQKLRQAAQGFEAIFVRQILATARQSSFGGKDLFGANPVGSGDDTFTQMRDDRFAEIASQSGSFGLAKQIEAQLARTLDPAPPKKQEG
ncbi:rod-binding protein [Novosphingobium sp. KCTC 2891]|uniref:rod-binding protein n=1 Tax=Novosphingobium sp. KCTC 2891 TaxID=2989730 RepID=UPI0022227F16|nr:rod-binding protein [Novosphingobium sp. KCTC 2891]MCW1382998.1 rod-binding protein [Novosphingobium sp. KCTC 2891]